MENSQNTNEDALQALENAMELLCEGKTSEAAGGICVWVTPSGPKICAQILKDNRITNDTIN